MIEKHLKETGRYRREHLDVNSLLHNQTFESFEIIGYSRAVVEASSTCNQELVRDERKKGKLNNGHLPRAFLFDCRI